MKCAYCNRTLTERQQRVFRSKHGKKVRPPKPVCSVRCRRKMSEAPPKSERTERWAREGEVGG